MQNEPVALNEIVYFAELDPKIQDSFRAKSMVYYPDIFGTNSSKFLPLVKFLLTDFLAVAPSIRDIFSASGKQEIRLTTVGTFTVRALDARLHALAPLVAEIIAASSESTLKSAWGVSSIDEDRIHQYSQVLNSCSEQVNNPILVGDAFLSGL